MKMLWPNLASTLDRTEKHFFLYPKIKSLNSEIK